MNTSAYAIGSSKEKLNKYLLMSGIVIFCLFVIARDILHISYSKYILVALAGVVGLFLSHTNLVSFISFLIPLSCGIPGNYIFVILTLLYVAKRPKLSVQHIVFSAIFVGQELLLSFLSSDSDLVELVAYCFKLFLTFGIIFDTKDTNNRQHLVAFVLGTTFLLVMIFAITTQFIKFEYMMSGEFRLGETKVPGMSTIQFGTNANTIGFYSLLAISVCLMLIRLTKGLKWLYISSLVINLSIGLLSVSRTYILFLAIIAVLFLFTGFKLNARGIIGLIITLALALVFVNYFAENTGIFEGYETRFEDSTAETGGGRTEIMERYFDWQLSNPFYALFGAGALNHVKLSGFGSPHNGLQQILISYGLIGFVIMISAFVWAMILAINRIKKQKLVYLPFIATFLFLQTVQFLFPTEYLMSVIYGYMAVKLFSNVNDVLNEQHNKIEVK